MAAAEKTASAKPQAAATNLFKLIEILLILRAGRARGKSRPFLFPRLADLVDVAHARLDGLARLQLLTPQIEQLVPKLVLTAVRNDEAVIELILPVGKLDRLRVVDGIRDRRLIRQDLLAACFVEREALVDRGLLRERASLVLRVEQIGRLDDEHVAFPVSRGITRAARQPLLRVNLPVADVDAPRLVVDLVDDRELIGLLNELDRVCARQRHHR